jgi:hypothetical protein
MELEAQMLKKDCLRDTIVPTRKKQIPLDPAEGPLVCGIANSVGEEYGGG